MGGKNNIVWKSTSGKAEILSVSRKSIDLKNELEKKKKKYVCVMFVLWIYNMNFIACKISLILVLQKLAVIEKLISQMRHCKVGVFCFPFSSSKFFNLFFYFPVSFVLITTGPSADCKVCTARSVEEATPSCYTLHWKN